MKHVWLGFAAVGLMAGALFTGCGDDTEPPTGPSSSSSGTGGHGHGGMGGQGGMGCCATNADCGPDTECRTFVCDQCVCTPVDKPLGTPATDQTATGDCKQTVCDGAGATVVGDDDMDVPDDMNECTIDTCDNGVGKHDPEPMNTMCTTGGTVCDGAGACVECVDGAMCMSGVCQGNACVPGSCGDTMKNGGETDVDCGGPVCGKCDDGKVCMGNTDCKSAICSNGACAMPSCTDATKNGSETDTDCGGSCPDCADGLKCLTGADCQSGVCGGVPLTCQMISCMDGVENGGETDVDCGNVCPNKCGPGKGCAINADCKGGACNAVLLTCDPTCTDGVKNNLETDADCGGGVCAACANGKGCTVDADCVSGLCNANVCGQVNGCDPTNALDLTGMASTSISFVSFSYSPKCIKVKAGTTVTFNGTFASHPLKAGEVKGAVEVPAAPGTSPLPTSANGQNSGNSASFVMTPVGVYPYYCIPHGPVGMNGAIFVVP